MHVPNSSNAQSDIKARKALENIIPHLSSQAPLLIIILVGKGRTLHS